MTLNCGPRNALVLLARGRPARGASAGKPSRLLEREFPQSRNRKVATRLDDHPAVSDGAWRSQAASPAACSSRSTVEDFAGVPLLISAPCSHWLQISTRGSGAAVAPTWPQCGQTIRVNMSVATAADGAAPQVSIARRR